ncbi:MAG: hypothetical protein Q9159_005496 [Coniocarpon cinnabarinum]
MADMHSDAPLNVDPSSNSDSDHDGGHVARDAAGVEADETNVNSTSDQHLTQGEATSPSDENHLTAVDTVKSAANAAKRRLHLDSIRATGPSKRFNPTNVRVHVKWKDELDSDLEPLTETKTRATETYHWRSRDNRKGRNSVVVAPRSRPSAVKTRKQRVVAELKQIRHVLWRMCTVFAYWDTAWWSGWTYSVGSVLFIMDGSWQTKSALGQDVPENLTKYGASLSFFFGALLYQLGAVMAYLEAVNDGSFQGSAMQRFLEGHEDDSKKLVDEKIHAFFGHFSPHLHLHHHNNEKKAIEDAASSVDPELGWKTKDRRERPGSIYPAGKAPAPRRGGVDHGEVDEGTSKVYMTWRWYPTWHALRTHHAYEIGYIACAIQLFGATLYGMLGVVVLPGIFDGLKNWQAEGAFWVPDIVGSVCFITASIMFMLEPQEKWYRPAFDSIGWWVGAWALVGSIGFILSGIFGAIEYDYEWGDLQAEIATIWGSVGYLISSLLQWYEAMNKRPVPEFLH